MAGDRSSLGLMWLHRSRPCDQNHTNHDLGNLAHTTALHPVRLHKCHHAVASCPHSVAVPPRRPATPSRHSSPQTRGAAPVCGAPGFPVPTPYPAPCSAFTTFRGPGPRLRSAAPPHTAKVTLAASLGPPGLTGRCAGAAGRDTRTHPVRMRRTHCALRLG